MRTPRLSLMAGILGASGVGLGAFGAHALKEHLAVAGTAAIWDKAVLYHLVHSVAVLAVALLTEMSGTPVRPCLRRATVCWSWGVVFFSGSLYALALGGPKIFGPVTPIGGVLLIAGWICVIVAGATQSAEAPRE